MRKSTLVWLTAIPLIAIILFNAPAFGQEKPDIFVQLGHSDEIKAVAFSPDGKFVLSGGTHIFKLWDVETGREIRTFKGHFLVNKIVFSPDGRYAISASASTYDKHVILWDVTQGREIAKLQGHKDAITSIAFSRDGKYILSGSGDKTLTLWNMATRKEVRTFYGHTKKVWSVAFSPDGQHALSGSSDKTLRLWELKTGKEVRRIEGGEITHVAFDPSGKYSISKGSKGVTLWDMGTGTMIKRFYHLLYVSPIAFSPDGKYIFGYQVRNITLWDAKTGQELQNFKVSQFGMSALALSPDGKFAITEGGLDKTLHLWDLASGKEIRKFKGFAGQVNSIALSPNGKYVASGSDDKIIKIWDIASGREVKRSTINIDHVTSIAYSPDGKNVLAGGWDLQRKAFPLMRWDVAKKEDFKRFQGSKQSVYSVAYSPDGRYALSAGDDKILRLWDTATGMEIKKFQEGKKGTSPVTFSPDGKYAMSGGEYKTFRLWDLKTGREVRTFHGHSQWVASINFSTDGRYLVSGGEDGHIILWDMKSGKEMRRLTGHAGTGSVYSVAFSPDGRHVLSGGWDRTLRLWEVATGKEVWKYQGHSAEVKSVAFTKDGNYALSGSFDGTVKIVDVSTGRELATFVSFIDNEWITITPEGYFNASQNGAKHLNVRIRDKVYPIDSFYEKFFNPMYVASVLQGKKVDAIADIRKGVLTPPDVRIISPRTGTTFNKDTIDIVIAAKDTGGGIDEIRLYHNGKVIGEDRRGLKVVSKKIDTIKTYTVTLVDGTNTFRAVGFSKDRTESNPYVLTVNLAAMQKDVSLYILAVGINRYKNPALNLNYAEPDARGIVGFFRKQGKGFFKKVDVRDIYNEDATKKTILSKFKQLENTNPQDVVLIYLAGHGESIADRWFFIPHELTYPEREGHVKEKGISSEELTGLIKNMRAQKVLVLIDSCKSGAVLMALRGFEDRKALAQLSRSTGTHVIAASGKDQFAAEVKDLGHGVFTYTLLEGLKGKAAGGGEAVTVRKLMGYIEERLPDITEKYKQEAQYPVVDSRGMDFPLVQIK